MNITIRGIEDVQQVLNHIAPKHARALARSAVHAVAADIAKEARKAAPKQSGTLKKSIKAKRRKSHPMKPRSTVNVGAWYWHFVEFGTVKEQERPFFVPIYHRTLANIKPIFVDKFKKQLMKKLARVNRRQS